MTANGEQIRIYREVAVVNINIPGLVFRDKIKSRKPTRWAVTILSLEECSSRITNSIAISVVNVQPVKMETKFSHTQLEPLRIQSPIHRASAPPQSTSNFYLKIRTQKANYICKVLIRQPARFIRRNCYLEILLQIQAQSFLFERTSSDVRHEILMCIYSRNVNEQWGILTTDGGMWSVSQSGNFTPR